MELKNVLRIAMAVKNDGVSCLSAVLILLGSLAAPRATAALSGTWAYAGPKNLATPNTFFGLFDTFLGSGPVSGRVNALAYDPANPSQTYWAGGASGGLWRSVDGGQTWASLSEGALFAWPVLQVSSIAVDPTDRNVVYVGTGVDRRGGADGTREVSRGIGIMKSTLFIEAGLVFSRLASTEQFGTAPVKRIIVNPDSSRVVLAATGRGGTQPGKLWRSSNAGDAFDSARDSSGTKLPDADWTGLAASTTDPADANSRRAFYAVGTGNPPQLWRSEDAGATWQQMASPLSTGSHRIDIAASTVSSASGSKTVYLLDGEQKIWKSTNRGDTWVDITGNFPHANTRNNGRDVWDQADSGAFFIKCSSRPSRSGRIDVVYVGLVQMTVSTDGGISWQRFGADLLHEDNNALAINPTNPNEFLVGNDGGAYKVTFDPTFNTFSSVNLNKLLPITEFRSGAWHPTTTTRMLGGSQDNATPTTTGDLNNWKCIFPDGDGAGCGIDPQNPKTQFATVQHYRLRTNPVVAFHLTRDGWSGLPFTEFDISDPVADGEGKAVKFPPLGVDFRNPSRVYLGTDRVHRWTDDGFGFSHFDRTHALFSVARITAFGLGPSKTDRVYVGANDGQLLVSSDDMHFFQRVDNVSANGTLLPNRPITCISLRPDNSQSILVGLAGTGTGHLWHGFHAHDPTEVQWFDVSGSGLNALPDLPVNCVARDLDDPNNTWYVGTDLGVWMTSDGGDNWSNIGARRGLPNVKVSAIGTVAATRSLFAATFGRGMWRISLGTGTFQLTPPEAAVAVHERLTYGFTWTVPAPLNWHNLQFLQLRIRDGAETIFSLIFDEASETFNLLNEATGRFGHGFPAGSPNRLQTPEATLYLADTSVVGSGPAGPSVTLNLALSFKPRAAGRTFLVEVAASDDNGNVSDFTQAGTLFVAP